MRSFLFIVICALLSGCYTPEIIYTEYVADVPSQDNPGNNPSPAPTSSIGTSADLQALLSASCATLKLLKDYALTSPIRVNSPVIIDLNGFTVEMKNTSCSVLVFADNVIFKNGVIKLDSQLAAISEIKSNGLMHTGLKYDSVTIFANSPFSTASSDTTITKSTIISNSVDGISTSYPMSVTDSFIGCLGTCSNAIQGTFTDLSVDSSVAAGYGVGVEIMSGSVAVTNTGFQVDQLFFGVSSSISGSGNSSYSLPSQLMLASGAPVLSASQEQIIKASVQGIYTYESDSSNTYVSTSNANTSVIIPSKATSMKKISSGLFIGTSGTANIINATAVTYTESGFVGDVSAGTSNGANVCFSTRTQIAVSNTSLSATSTSADSSITTEDLSAVSGIRKFECDIDYYYIGAESGLFVSQNFGASYYNSLQRFVYDFVRVGANIVAATSDGVYISVDNGQSFGASVSALSGVTVYSVAYSNSDGFYFNTQNGLYSSQDLVSYSRVSLPVLGFFENDLRVGFILSNPFSGSSHGNTPGSSLGLIGIASSKFTNSNLRPLCLSGFSSVGALSCEN